MSASVAGSGAPPEPKGAQVIPLASCRSPRLSRRDQEFLPAALEILETPPSPVRLFLLVTICALATVALIWAYVGRMDIVAVAQGKIQPTGRVKVLQSLETGRVRAIAAENGQHVNARDVLIELDATEAQAEEMGLRASVAAYAAEAERRREAVRVAAELVISGSDVPDIVPRALAFQADTPKEIWLREQRVLSGDLGQLEATLASLAAQRVQKEAERERLRATIAAQRDLLSTLRERVTMRTTLVEKSAGTKAGLIDATETLQYQQGALATQVGQLAETEAALGVARREMRKVRDTFVAENAQKLADAERQVDDLDQRLAKAKARTEHMTLRAPLSGTVHGSSVTTIGQVVMPSEELLRIVPDGSQLEIEAYLQNKDIGFVQPNQEATIKIEAFPFTRYGTVPGMVVRVATDAIPEPDAQQIEGNPAKSPKTSGFTGGAQRIQNLVFPIAIRPQATTLVADAGTVPLSPGMAVSVEIKTGRRRILEYLFSPLVEVASESMRER